MKFDTGMNGSGQPYSFQIGEKEFFIREIMDQWYGKEHQFYKVRADDGNIYVLKHSPITNQWELEFFKKDASHNNYIS